jgi:hypothetical protein
MNGRLSTGNALFPALGDEIHNSKKQEGVVRCAVASDRRVPLPAPVGPKVSECVEVFVQHCLRPGSVLLSRARTP